MERRGGVERYGRAAAQIAGWTLLSRVLGLVRDRLMFGEFGRGLEAGAFLLAWTVPNLFRRLFGEGALTAAFIPVLTRRLERGGLEGGRRCFAAVAGVLLVLLTALLALCLAGAALVPEAWLARGGRGAAGAAYAELLRALLFILLPYLVPVCFMTLAAAAQQVRGRFVLPAAAPALLNGFWIAGVLYAGTLSLPAADKALRLGFFLLAGGLAQVLLQLPGLKRSGLAARPRFAPRDPDVQAVARGVAPMVLGLSIAQLNVLLSYAIAAFRVPAPGANAVLFLGNRLLDFPHALLGVALGTAVFPLLALLGERGEERELAGTLDRALASGLFLAVPAAAGLAALAPWLVGVLFVHGRFSAGDGRETTLVVRLLACGLPGLVAAQVLARAHYALGDRRTPVRAALVLLALAAPAHFVLAPLAGTAGMAAVSALTNLANALWLHVSLLGRGLPGRPRTRAALARAVLASLPTALGALWAAATLDRLLPAPAHGFFVRLPAVLLLPALLGVAVFLLSARLLRAPELGVLLAALRRRAP